MARKLQKLINYHTSGNTSMPAAGDVALGEIVVRHNDQKPELLIKKNDDSFATFIDSVAVENAILVAQTKLEGQISLLSGNVDTKFSNYYTKTEVDDNVADAKDEAIAAANAYTDGEISELDGKLSGQITTVSSNIDTVSASVKTFSASVVSNYATKTEVTNAEGRASAYTDTEIATAKSEVFDSAKTYTDGAISGLNETLTTNIASVESKVNILIHSDSGKSVRDIAVEEISKVVAEAPESYDTLKEIADWIQNDTTGAAIMANDIENLKKADSALTTSINTVDANVNTLSGVVSAFSATVFSNYATKTGVTADIKTAKDGAIGAASAYTDGEISKLNSTLSSGITGVDGRVTSLSGVVSAFSATVFSNYATKTGVTADIKTAKDGAIGAASAYTDDEISELNSALTASITALDSRIDTLETLTGTTQSAVQEIVVKGTEYDSENQTVEVEKSGSTVTIDFTNMVIDCGDF